MPKGKDIYDDFSKRIGEKKKRKVFSKKDDDGTPPTVNVYKTNKSSHAKPRNYIPPVVRRRNISETEGAPMVNAAKNVKRLIKKIEKGGKQEQIAPSIDKAVKKTTKGKPGRKPKSA